MTRYVHKTKYNYEVTWSNVEFFKLELENLLFHVKGIKAIEKQLAVE